MQLSATDGRMTTMKAQMKTDVADELCDRVIRALGDAEPRDALNALLDALGYNLSTIICADCRAEAARAFTQAIPAVVEHANELAIEYAAMRSPEHDADTRAHVHH
jgi:hypothetical protein